MIQISFISIISLLVSVLCDDTPIIDSPAGKFKGHLVKTRYGRDVFSYEGIPYAEPPVGQLRFKDPVKRSILEGTYDATNGSIKCFQPPLDVSQFQNVSVFEGSEDCLYLNVHVPKTDKASTALPVMVWIHGGGFIMGSGSAKMNGPDYLLDKDMILVTLNYRLGILGFLSTGDKEIPGNFGLKDQIMALKWVQENIASFGGDPSTVTIAGESAGGASVSLLMHSPLSKGLFHRVIAQSGSAFTFYALKEKIAAKSQSKEIALNLGCSEEPQQFLKCLQRLPINELFEAVPKTQPYDILAFIQMSPVLEDPSPNAFITVASLNQTMEMPIMTGVTSKEAIPFYKSLAFGHPKYKEGGLQAIRNDLYQLIPKWGYYGYKPNKDNITEKIINFYFGNRGAADATVEQIIDLLSDALANYGMYHIGKTEKGPTYLYMLSYKGKNKIPEGDMLAEFKDEVIHGEDLFYLFNMDWYHPSKELNNEELEMSNKIVDMWYNFIKYGDPTPDSKIWKESEGGTKYLDITNQGLIMKSNLFQQRMQFLDKLVLEEE